MSGYLDQAYAVVDVLTARIGVTSVDLSFDGPGMRVRVTGLLRAPSDAETERAAHHALVDAANDVMELMQFIGCRQLEQGVWLQWKEAEVRIEVQPPQFPADQIRAMAATWKADAA